MLSVNMKLNALWPLMHIMLHSFMQPFYGFSGFCPGLPRWAGTRKIKPGR